MIFKKKKKEKYNGFWKWCFYTELLILIFAIVYVYIDSKRPSVLTSRNNSIKCVSAICDCKAGEKMCKCQYYDDNGELKDGLLCPNKEPAEVEE